MLAAKVISLPCACLITGDTTILGVDFEPSFMTYLLWNIFGGKFRENHGKGSVWLSNVDATCVKHLGLAPFILGHRSKHRKDEIEL